MPFDYEYRILDLFQCLLCTPQLRHLWLSGLGPTIYDVTLDWVVPLGFLETLYLHYCRLQAEILFVGICLQKDGGDSLPEFPVLTLEISVTDSTQRFGTVCSGRCIQSFRSLSAAHIQELTVHSYQWPQGRMENPVHNLLRSLSPLRKLVLEGCDESPFYEALSRIRVQGRRGRRGLSIVCPHLAVMEIDPIVEFQKYLGDQTPCRMLVKNLSKLIQKRKGCGAPLKKLRKSCRSCFRPNARRKLGTQGSCSSISVSGRFG